MFFIPYAIVLHESIMRVWSTALNRVRLHRIPWVVVAVATANLVLGCGEGKTSPGDTASDVFQADASPEKSCESNRDCAGGEICRDELCRLACLTADECTAPVPVCDEAAGYCVGCIDSEDCGPNDICTNNNCVFYCSEDAACSETSFVN